MKPRQPGRAKSPTSKPRPASAVTCILAGLVLLAISGPQYPCSAATAVFQAGSPEPFGAGIYTNVQDTMLVFNNSGEMDQNFGARSDFEVGEVPNYPSCIRHVLIRFDVTSLAARFVAISNITLRLFVTVSYDIGSGDTLEAFLLTTANNGWVEGSGTSSDLGQPPDCGMSTWAQEVECTANWAGSPGASTPEVDYVSAPIATDWYAPSNTDVGTYINLVFTNTSFFSDWLAGRNPGLLLRTRSENDSSLTFASSQSTTVAWRPALTVHYAPTAPETNLLSIRVSQVELCWPSTSNTLYQVQYRSDLTTNLWTDLGAPVQGNGSTNCVYDAVVRGQPKRFYRFVTIP